VRLAYYNLGAYSLTSAYGIAVNSDNPGRILVFVSSGLNKILVYQTLNKNSADVIQQLIDDLKNNPEINDRIKAI
jgi:hypothetical protein